MSLNDSAVIFGIFDLPPIKERFGFLGWVSRITRMRSSSRIAGSSFGSCGTKLPRNALTSSAGVRPST